MGQYDGAVSLRPVVGRAEQTPQHRTKSHDVEVRPVDDSGAYPTRLAQADHGEVDGGELAEGGHRLDAVAEVLDLRYGENGILYANAERAVSNVDEAVFILVLERPQQNAPDDAEDRRVDADPECQGKHHCNGQTLDPAQGPQRKP